MRHPCSYPFPALSPTSPRHASIDIFAPPSKLARSRHRSRAGSPPVDVALFPRLTPRSPCPATCIDPSRLASLANSLHTSDAASRRPVFFRLTTSVCFNFATFHCTSTLPQKLYVNSAMHQHIGVSQQKKKTAHPFICNVCVGGGGFPSRLEKYFPTLCAFDIDRYPWRFMQKKGGLGLRGSGKFM